MSLKHRKGQTNACTHISFEQYSINLPLKCDHHRLCDRTWHMTASVTHEPRTTMSSTTRRPCTPPPLLSLALLAAASLIVTSQSMALTFVEEPMIVSQDALTGWLVSLAFIPGVWGLAPKWVRFDQNRTNPGLFQIRFQYILARGAKMYWNLIWKSPGFVPFRSNLTQFGPKIWHPWHSQTT